MKRIFSILAACATMFALAACQEELQQPVEEQKPVLEGIEGELQEVTFSVNLEDKAQTKAISDGLSANKLEYAVYYADDRGLSSNYEVGDYIEVLSTGSNAKIEKSGDSDRTWKVTLTLAKNVKYDIVFWAYAEGAPYTFNEAEGKIIVDHYEGAANAEIRDAFYGICKGYSVISSDERVELRRPFAQINFGACDYIPYVTDLGLEVTSKIDTEKHEKVEAVYEYDDPINGRLLYAERPEVAQCTVPNILNVLDGTVSGEAVVKFQLADIPFKGGDEVLLSAKNAEGETIPYHWMGMNYILAGSEATINNIHATFHYNGQDLVFDVPNVPYKRNFKTNIIGNLFTENAKFNVVVLPEYENEIIIKDGQAYDMPEINGNKYIVKTSMELAWIADQVNSGLNDFAGKTVSIASDINLSNYNWTPIGTNEYPFKGTIQPHEAQTKSAAAAFSISGLKVNHTEGPAGLVGVLNGGAVKNITLVEPVVNGKEFVGAAVGKIFPDGLVEGVTVTGGQVNGNHFVGGLVGHAYGSVKNSAVDGVKVSGVYVDEDLDGAKIGGVIGFHPIDADDTEVSGNVVKSLEITGKSEVGAVAGAANAKNIKGNGVESATIVADTYADVVVGHVFNDEGEDAILDPKANTYVHENITVNGQQARPAEYIFEVTYEADAVEIPVEGGSFYVKVAGNVAWTLTVPEGVTASLAEGNGPADITFTISANEDTADRSFKVVIASEVKSYEIILNQKAAAPAEPEFEGGKFWIVADGKYAMPLSSSYGYLRDPDVQGYIDNAFTFSKVDGGFTIQDATGKYYYMNGDYDTFNTSTTLPEEGAVWTVEKSGDDAYKITNVLKQKFIQFDGGYGSFASYAEMKEKGVIPTLIDASAATIRPVLTLSETAKTVEADATEYTFAVNANVEWTATPSAGVTLAIEDSNVTMTFDANTAEEAVVHTVKVAGEGLEATFTLTQKGVPAPGEPEQTLVVYNHTFKSGELKTSASTAKLSGINWDFSGATYIGWDSNKGIQLGSKNNPAKNVTLSTSAITGPVNVIKVNSSVGSGGDGKLAVYVGGVQYGNTVSLTANATEYTFDIAGAKGEIEIRWTNTAKAMYVKSISVEYLQ